MVIGRQESMFKKISYSKLKLFILFLTLSSVFCFLSSVDCFGQVAKISKFLPPKTKLVSQKTDQSQEIITIYSHSFATYLDKNKVIDFYRLMFKNEGFRELQGYSPERKLGGPQLAYFFARPNELLLLNFMGQPEPADGSLSYYVTLTHTNTEAIKKFNDKAKAYEQENPDEKNI
jgi:hypothetical protein